MEGRLRAARGGRIRNNHARQVDVNPTEHRADDRELVERVAQLPCELETPCEHLKKSESETRSILDSIPGLIALMSPAGAIETVNRPLLEYFGQSVEQLKGWGTNDTVHPEDLPHVI